VRFVADPVVRIEHENNRVETENGSFKYDFLIIATGCRIVPEENEGLPEEWGKRAFSFYTAESAEMLSNALNTFNKGRLVMCIAEMPIKCPVAPLEFVFMADWYLREKGVRENVEIELATPFPRCLPNWPKASVILSEYAHERKITLTADFTLQRVDRERKCIESYTGKSIEYDLLVIIPTNCGDNVIATSGMDDGSTFIPTDKKTLKALNHKNIYVIGDATNVPTSKAGSVAHYESEVVTENILAEIHGKEPESFFDGHSTCFIVSGKGRSFLVDFNYSIEPLPGKYPFPYIGPFSLLKNTAMNWKGKLWFEWLYWNVILPGRGTGMPPTLTMAGKKMS
jgi:sulfide:quinone oxidoreductase